MIEYLILSAVGISLWVVSGLYRARLQRLREESLSRRIDMLAALVRLKGAAAGTEDPRSKKLYEAAARLLENEYPRKEDL